MFDGWVKVYRQILENPLWTDKPFSKGQAWIDLILLSNHKKGYIKIKNGLNISIERGECGYSALALSDRWGWSRNRVNRFLKYLKSEKMIQLKTIDNRFIIKVLNYEFFQGDTLNETVNGHLTNHQTDINKNDKNERNIVSTKVDTCQNAKVLTHEKSLKTTPYNDFVNLYNSKCTNLAKISKLTDERKRKIKIRLNYQPSLEVWQKCFVKANASEFCCNGRWCNFDWFVANDTNHLKVLEGKYDNKDNGSKNLVDNYFKEKEAQNE